MHNITPRSSYYHIVGWLSRNNGVSKAGGALLTLRQ